MQQEKKHSPFSPHHDGSCSRFPKPRDECLGNCGRTGDHPTGTDIRQHRGQTSEGDFLVSCITHDEPVLPLPAPGGLGGTNPVTGSAPGQGHQPGSAPPLGQGAPCEAGGPVQLLDTGHRAPAVDEGACEEVDQGNLAGAIPLEQGSLPGALSQETVPSRAGKQPAVSKRGGPDWRP